MEWNLDGLETGLLSETNGRPPLQQSQIKWLADGDSPPTRWAPKNGVLPWAQHRRGRLRV